MMVGFAFWSSILMAVGSLNVVSLGVICVYQDAVPAKVPARRWTVNGWRWTMDSGLRRCLSFKSNREGRQKLLIV